MKILSAALSIAVMAQVAYIPASFAQAADASGVSADSAVSTDAQNGGTCYEPVQKHKMLRTYTKTSTSTSTSTTSTPVEQQVITQPAVCAPTCAPETILQQPAVVEGVPGPIIMPHHMPIWPWLLGAAAIATAIAVPLAVTHHHHHHNNTAFFQQQQLLFAQPVAPPPAATTLPAATTATPV
jgi:hypothetical protein